MIQNIGMIFWVLMLTISAITLSSHVIVKLLIGILFFLLQSILSVVYNPHYWAVRIFMDVVFKILTVFLICDSMLYVFVNRHKLSSHPLTLWVGWSLVIILLCCIILLFSQCKGQCFWELKLYHLTLFYLYLLSILKLVHIYVCVILLCNNTSKSRELFSHLKIILTGPLLATCCYPIDLFSLDELLSIYSRQINGNLATSKFTRWDVLGIEYFN